MELSWQDKINLTEESVRVSQERLNRAFSRFRNLRNKEGEEVAKQRRVLYREIQQLQTGVIHDQDVLIELLEQQVEELSPKPEVEASAQAVTVEPNGDQHAGKAPVEVALAVKLRQRNARGKKARKTALAAS